MKTAPEFTEWSVAERRKFRCGAAASGYRRRFCFRPFAGLNRFANRSFKKLIDAMRTYTAGMQSQRESSAPTAEASQAVRRTQDSDGNEKTAREGGRYSIAEIDGKKYVKFDRQVLSGDDPKVWEKQLRDYINNEIRKGERICTERKNRCAH